MDQFSTQYMPSNAGLVRAVPLMQKALKTGGGVIVAVFFASGFVSFFFVGLANSLLPRVWPGYPSGLSIAIGCVLFATLTLGLVMPWIRARTARRFDQLLPPTLTRLKVDEAGLTISDELSHGHWEWRHIRGAIPTPDGVAVLMGYSGMLVTKGAFADAAEQHAFIELVNRRSDRTSI
jgi:hypothetical protein